MSGEIEKEGFDTGCRAINPFTNEPVPIWVANFVLGEYGTGAIMAVPAHDQRDHEFATKYGLPIRPVIVPAALDATMRQTETELRIAVDSARLEDRDGSGGIELREQFTAA